MMFGIWSRLIAAAVVVALLGGIYWRGHTQGYKARDTIALADDAARVAEALQASEQARKVEQELSTKVRKVSDDYRTARKNLDNLASASSDGLRNLAAILAAPAVASSSAGGAGRTDGTGGLERELLGSCAAALTELGKTADRLEAKIVGLQGYVAGVCVK